MQAGKTKNVDLVDDQGKRLVGKLNAPLEPNTIVVLSGKDKHGERRERALHRQVGRENVGFLLFSPTSRRAPWQRRLQACVVDRARHQRQHVRGRDRRWRGRWLGVATGRRLLPG
jgi:hypothetical protein